MNAPLHSDRSRACRAVPGRRVGRARAAAEDAALQVLLRRARVRALRGDLRSARVLPDPHRALDHGVARGGDGRPPRPEVPARRVRQRLLAQDATAARPPARSRRLRPDRHLAGRARAIRRARSRRAIRSSRCCRSAPTTRRRSRCRSRVAPVGRRGVYFPGSTIGNFTPPRRSASWRAWRAWRARAACCSSASICARTARRWSAPTTTRRASRRPSTATCWCASTASSAATSTSSASRTARAGTKPQAASRCTSSRSDDQIVRVAGRRVRVRGGRDDPHRELVQVRSRALRGARRGRRSRRSRGVDGPGAALQRAAARRERRRFAATAAAAGDSAGSLPGRPHFGVLIQSSSSFADWQSPSMPSDAQLRSCRQRDVASVQTRPPASRISPRSQTSRSSLRTSCARISSGSPVGVGRR